MIAEYQNDWEAQWQGAYTENFAVYEPQIGLTEKQIVENYLDPLANLDGNAIEIGCGSGRAWSKKHLVKRFKYVTGVDVLRRDWVVDDQSPKNFGYIQVAPDDYSLSMFEDGSVDFVWSFGCMCHLVRDAMREYLKSAHRVLKPGGNAVFEFFATTRRMPLRPGADEKAMRGKPWTCVLDETEPPSMMADAGFVSIIDYFPQTKTVLLQATKAQ